MARRARQRRAQPSKASRSTKTSRVVAVGPGQAAEGDREIRAIGGHQPQQVVDQGLVACVGAGQAELGSKRSEHGRCVLGLVRFERGQHQLAGCLRRAFDRRQQCLCQGMQVPERHCRLARVGIAALVVAVVADVAGVERVQEAERSVIDRQSEQGHVVGVHDAVAEAHRLPLRDQPRGAQRNLPEQGGRGLGMALQGGEVAGDRRLEQVLQRRCVIGDVRESVRSGQSAGSWVRRG